MECPTENQQKEWIVYRMFRLRIREQKGVDRWVPGGTWTATNINIQVAQLESQGMDVRVYGPTGDLVYETGHATAEHIAAAEQSEGV